MLCRQDPLARLRISSTHPRGRFHGHPKSSRRSSQWPPRPSRRFDHQSHLHALPAHFGPINSCAVRLMNRGEPVPIAPHGRGETSRRAGFRRPQSLPLIRHARLAIARCPSGRCVDLGEVAVDHVDAATHPRSSSAGHRYRSLALALREVGGLAAPPRTMLERRSRGSTRFRRRRTRVDMMCACRHA